MTEARNNCTGVKNEDWERNRTQKKELEQNIQCEPPHWKTQR